METQERLLECPFCGTDNPPEAARWNDDENSYERSVRVAGRSSPRPCNWSGRPVRSIPITKNDDSPTFFMYGDHSPPRWSDSAFPKLAETRDLEGRSHAVEAPIALSRRFSLAKPHF